MIETQIVTGFFGIKSFPKGSSNALKHSKLSATASALHQMGGLLADGVEVKEKDD